MKITIEDSFWESINYMGSWRYKLKKLPRTIRLWLYPRARIQSRYLKSGWQDYDTILAHSMFEILSRFIEQECSLGIVEWYTDQEKIIVNKEEVYVRDEMQDLYDWWHDVYIPWSEGKDEFSIKTDQKLKDFNLENFIDCLNKKENERSDIEKEYIEILHSQNQKDAEMSKELESRMHRLIRIKNYLWT